MKKVAPRLFLCLGVVLLTSGYLYASGSGSHSHGHHAVEKSSDNSTISYRDSKDGVDAYLEFCDFKHLASKDSKGFLVKCYVKSYLRDAKTGEKLQPSKILLRATIGHDQFGEAMVFKPADDDKMQAELFVKNKGEHHYLLIAEIDGVGVKKFHFHHTF